MDEDARHDIVSSEVRSRMMKAVRQIDTEPEYAVRRHVRALGLGYRTRNRDLPGSPDLANRTNRWAVFVNGCFWHGHKNCPRLKSGRTSRIPKTNDNFWREKLRANRSRDARKILALRKMGYVVVLVWECRLERVAGLLERLKRRSGGKIASRGHSAGGHAA